MARWILSQLRTVTPWTLIAIVGCAVLTLVGFWRDGGPTAWPLVRGTLPNLVAVPTLAFGFLMLRFPERISPEAEAVQTR